tara:strand:- start:63 stop:242 length:180 start_codon:yes stop_codon:yes gene_type:complete
VPVKQSSGGGGRIVGWPISVEEEGFSGGSGGNGDIEEPSLKGQHPKLCLASSITPSAPM